MGFIGPLLAEIWAIKVYCFFGEKKVQPWNRYGPQGPQGRLQGRLQSGKTEALLHIP